MFREIGLIWRIPVEKMAKPINPEVIVQLSGTDGNALAIIGAVRLAMRRAALHQNSPN